MSNYKIAVDTGGTFTDICLLNDAGQLFIHKQPSTPNDPSRAVLDGITHMLNEQVGETTKVDLVLHGTTVATNAILEQKGARAALITTRGFRDVLFIGRQNRPHLYNFWVLKPLPLIPRELIFEIDERVLADGTVKTPIRKEDLEFITREVISKEIESVAVCLLHSYITPEHEQIVKAYLERKLPGIPVTISSDILREFREYERTNTTVINAIVKPRVEQYIARLEQNLDSIGLNGGFYIMQSNGGVITSIEAREQSARTVLSGPAGGVLAGSYLARLTGHKNLITADMGGTSMDICLIHNARPRFTTEGVIGGYPLKLPMLDIHTIGAGGGSIAWVDSGGALRVGPHSAGSLPGPSCYNQGGVQPTVTDANMVLGRLQPADLVGINNIKTELAAECIMEKVGQPLGLGLEETAEGIIKVVNANMARAMRVVSVQKGHDPRDFTLVAFGGACPLHAAELAGELGIPRILIPPYPGVTSAWGMLTADVRHDYSVSRVAELVPGVLPKVNKIMNKLAEQGKSDLLQEGFAAGEITLTRLMDLRYKGQSYELTLTIPNNNMIEADLVVIRQRFNRRHQQEYGYCREEAPIEIVTLRAVATGSLPKIKPLPQSGSKIQRETGIRRVYISGRYSDVPVYHRQQATPGWEISGPAVITQQDTTILVWPEYKARSDRWGNLIIETGVQ